jgi:hypothetical protein
VDLASPIKTVATVNTRLVIKNPLHWQSDTSRQKAFRVHRDTETIFLRFRKKMAGRNTNMIELVDYPLLSDYKYEIQGFLRELCSYYTIADFSVIIANLKSGGGTISTHVDNGPYFHRSHRVHIPIRTNDETIFTIGDIQMCMKDYIAYEIGNTNHRHGVVNNGVTDRYHMIFDLFTSPTGSAPSQVSVR